MQKLWKQREKQIQKVLESTINMYGSIKGIAGSAIKTIELLELDEEQHFCKYFVILKRYNFTNGWE